jgi:hypothetical protein
MQLKSYCKIFSIQESPENKDDIYKSSVVVWDSTKIKHGANILLPSQLKPNNVCSFSINSKDGLK